MSNVTFLLFTSLEGTIVMNLSLEDLAWDGDITVDIYCIIITSLHNGEKGPLNSPFFVWNMHPVVLRESKNDTWYHLISPRENPYSSTICACLASSTVKLNDTKLKIIFWYQLILF